MKNIKLRMQVTEYSHNSQYRHCYIQILDKQFPDTKTSDTLTVIGTISWQSDKDSVNWYSPTFKVDTYTDSLNEFTKMAKLVKFVNANYPNSLSSIQPEEFITLVSGIEYFNYKGDFIPCSYMGKMRYYYIQSIANNNAGNQQYYTHCIAANEILAMKELKRKMGNDANNYMLVDTGIIPTYLS